jgi:hypothetical protein
VLVAASEVQAAREVLLQADAEPLLSDSAGGSSLRVLSGAVLAVALVAIIVWLGIELSG